MCAYCCFEIDRPPFDFREHSAFDGVERMLWREWALTSPGLGDDTFTMIRALEADSVRWRVGDLCAEHHEHGRPHGEQGVRSGGDGQCLLCTQGRALRRNL